MIKTGFNPAKLDTKLTFYEPTKTAGNVGAKVTTWSIFSVRMAARKYKDDGEKVEGKQIVGGDKAHYTLRYDSASPLTTQMKFKQGTESTYFFIRNVTNEPRLGITTITAERRDND